MEIPKRGLVLNGWKLQLAATIAIVGLTVASNAAGLRQICNLLVNIVGGLHLLGVISFVRQRKWFFVFLAVIGWPSSIMLGIYASLACGFRLLPMME